MYVQPSKVSIVTSSKTWINVLGIHLGYLALRGGRFPSFARNQQENSVISRRNIFFIKVSFKTHPSFLEDSNVKPFCRFCTLLYLIVTTISEGKYYNAVRAPTERKLIMFAVSNIKNCNEILVAVGCTMVATSATTSLLFFIRVRAIFTGQRFVVGFFFVLWLANLGSAIAVPFLISDVHIGPTERCTGSSVNPWTAATLVITGINDTLVMMTVSYVLIDGMLLSPPGLCNGVMSFFTGKDLPQVARALLQGGQLYYL